MLGIKIIWFSRKDLLLGVNLYFFLAAIKEAFDN